MAKKGEQEETIDAAAVHAAIDRLTEVIDHAVRSITAAADSLATIAAALERLEKGYSNHRLGVPGV